MKYIIRNTANEIMLKLNSSPTYPFSGEFRWTCTHVSTNAILTLILDDVSQNKISYQKFVITSGESLNFLVGQYNVDVYDVTGGSKITNFTLMAKNAVVDNDVYFMANSNTAYAYEMGSTSIPDAPVGLTATLEASGVDVKLQYQLGSPNTDSLEIWRKTGSGGTSVILNNDVQSLIYIDSFLDVNTDYFYKIRGKNEIGYSAFSQEVSATTSYTATTATTAVHLIGSGGTTTTNVSGNTWIINSTAPTGATVLWGNVLGNINSQVDLKQALDLKLDTLVFQTYSASTESQITGNTAAIALKTSTVDFEYYTGTTAPNTYLTGVTWNDVQDKPSLFTGYTFTASGGTQLNLVGNDLTIYSPTGGTGGVSSWNDLTDKPEWLSGTTLESFQTGHTHSYNNLTDLPTLFDGDYDDLTNKPDLSLYQPVSGMSAYLTGVTFSMITGAVSGSTTLQAALDLKLDNSVYNGDMLIIGDEIDNLITGVTANTQSITEKLDTSVFITYSGTTVPNLLLGYTQTGTTENLSQAFDAHTGDTGIHFEMSQITGFTSTDSFNTFTGDTQTALDAKASKYAGLWLSTSNTQIDDNYNNYIIETNGTFNLTFDDDGGGLSDGFRCWIYNIGTGTISILGNVGAVIRGNTGITSQYDMVEVYYNSTGRIFSVSPVTVDTSGFLSTTDFNTYTGNTAPYLVVSGFTASGGTQLDLTNGNLTIYSPTGGTSSVTTLIGSGDTTVDNVSGSTWVIYSESGGGSSSSIVQKTGSTYTLQSEDNGNILEFTNTGSTTITLPSGFTANFQCTVVNYGNGTSSGVKTIAAGGGATLKSALSATKLSTIFGAATVYYRGTNTWLAFGDLTA